MYQIPDSGDLHILLIADHIVYPWPLTFDGLGKTDSGHFSDIVSTT